MSLNDVLVTFQTYNPMVPFLSESLDNVLVLEEEALFTRRSRLTLMIKIKHDVKVLKKSGKLNENQLRNL